MKLMGQTYLLAAALLLSPAGGEAAMYVCRNADGVVQFTNAPSSSDCKEYTKKGSRRTRVTTSSRPVDPDIYDSHIESAGSRYRIDPNLIRAVIRVESDFNRYAVSRTGAQGLMQLMPETAKELRVRDSFNPIQNIHGGTRYLRTLLDMFEGDLVLTLAAYNAGPTLVKKLNRVPRIQETKNYVKKVLVHYKQYRSGLPTYQGSSTIKVGGLKVASAR